MARNIIKYFTGGRVVKVQKQGYEEPLSIPKVERNVLTEAVSQAVKDGLLWLTSGPASIWAEEIPLGLLTDDASLQAPPPIFSSVEILPDSLLDAWQGDTTTALAISAALSKKAGQTLPWRRVRETIDGAIRARYLMTTADSGVWPCEYPGAQYVRLCTTKEAPPTPTPLPKPGVFIAEADLRPNEIQDLADVMGELTAAAAGNDLKFHLKIELGGKIPAADDVLKKLNHILQGITDKLQLL